MTEIRFEKHEDALDLLNPMSQFQPDRQRVEVRRDPLLGHTSIYNPALGDKAKILFGDIDRDWLGNMVAASAERCIFCPGRLDNLPKYPPHRDPGRSEQQQHLALRLLHHHHHLEEGAMANIAVDATRWIYLVGREVI